MNKYKSDDYKLGAVKYYLKHNENNYYCTVTRNANDMCGEEGKYYKKKVVKKRSIK